MDDRWTSLAEIAAYLGIGKDTEYTWASERRISGDKVGRFWKFKKDEVDGWVRAGGAAEVAASDTHEAG